MGSSASCYLLIASTSSRARARHAPSGRSGSRTLRVSRHLRLGGWPLTRRGDHRSGSPSWSRRAPSVREAVHPRRRVRRRGRDLGRTSWWIAMWIVDQPRCQPSSAPAGRRARRPRIRRGRAAGRAFLRSSSRRRRRGTASSGWPSATSGGFRAHVRAPHRRDGRPGRPPDLHRAGVASIRLGLRSGGPSRARSR